jgi:hypothetical protein
MISIIVFEIGHRSWIDRLSQEEPSPLRSIVVSEIGRHPTANVVTDSDRQL